MSKPRSTTETIEQIRAEYDSNRTTFDFRVSMYLAGNSNKELRQDIVKVITGITLPKSQCGLGHVSDVLKASFEQATLF